MRVTKNNKESFLVVSCNLGTKLLMSRSMLYPDGYDPHCLVSSCGIGMKSGILLSADTGLFFVLNKYLLDDIEPLFDDNKKDFLRWEIK